MKYPQLSSVRVLNDLEMSVFKGGMSHDCSHGCKPGCVGGCTPGEKTQSKDTFIPLRSG